MVTLTLPFPPSVNTIWRAFKNRVILSKKGRDYYKRAAVILLEQGIKTPTPEPVSVRIRVYPPDRRRRDLDNTLKAVLDAMSKRVYCDDWQIVKIEATKHEPITGGRIEVDVEHEDGLFPKAEESAGIY